MTTSGVVSTYPIPSGNAVNGITVGPDGALWFTEETAIGRVDTSGTVTEYSILNKYDGAEWITAAGPYLWFTAYQQAYPYPEVVGRMNTSGEVVGGSRLPFANYFFNAIGPGPGKMVWVAGQILNDGIIRDSKPSLPRLLSRRLTWQLARTPEAL